ncbi:hypothetical protein K438DRAFT_2016479 [Mycena galopus ATCC 62051]|nr:hypothetical protein K438DRAFT_2016479 [Mycena galopus ATCC 62051]
MCSEHPVSEADNIIRNGRMLSSLEPMRACRNTRYKWSRGLQVMCVFASPAPSSQATTARYTHIERAPTPSYVTAHPIVTHRVLNLLTADGAISTDKSMLHFVVLATDRLQDELSSEDLVCRVTGHLAGLSGMVPKSALSTHVLTVRCARIDGQRQRPLRTKWVFVDLSAMARTRRAFTLPNDNPKYVRDCMS